MIYALVGFVGVILGVLCTCVCLLLFTGEDERACTEEALQPMQNAADEKLAQRLSDNAKK